MEDDMAKKTGIVVVYILIGIAAVFGLIQLIPYGKNHTNPPTVKEPNWDSTKTRELTKQACFDCHSNETNWRWYTNFAPFSWLVQRDVDEGRRKLNFSEWGSRPHEVDEIGEVILEGEMPPFQYLIIHPEARLNDQEKNQLVTGLSNSLR
jgi:mono/diheme cytochrome c family protein